MLQTLNEKIQGAIAWIVILLVAVTFVLFGVDYYIQSRQSVSTDVAVVNGKPISKQALELAYRRQNPDRDEALNSDSAHMDKTRQQVVLDKLISMQLAVDAATAYGFDVDATQVNQAITHIPQFLEKGRFAVDRYQRLLASAFWTHASFQREVHDEMLLTQQRFAWEGTDFVLPNELTSFVQDLTQTRDYRYVTIPATTFVQNISITPDEIQAYYNAHPKAFLSDEQVSLDVVLLAPSASSKASNDRAQLDYAKAVDTLADISYQTPDSLDPVAKKLKLPIQTTPLFSKKGGETPLTQQPAIIQAAFSRDVLELGNNSAPIQLDQGQVAVVRIHEHRPAQQKALALVEADIQQRLVLEKAQAKALALAESIQQAATAEEREALLKAHQLNWISVNASLRTSDQPNDINTHAFAASVQSPWQRFKRDQAYVVLELQHVHPGDLKTLDKKQLTMLSQKLKSRDAAMNYMLFMQQLKAAGHIKLSTISGPH